MTTTAIDSPNAEHAAVWADIVAPKYTRFRRVLDDALAAHSATTIERAGVRAGQRVLDVGCGMGESSLQLARAVGADGQVIGVDVVASFLDIARREAAEHGATQISYVCADAQTHDFGGRFDVVFSRFGTMFFANPVAALRQIRRAMKPGATLAMAVWRRVEDNPVLNVAKQIAAALLPPVDDDAPNCGPGPFSMASADVTSDVMRAAGFERITFERSDIDVRTGRDIAEAIAFQLALGPAGELVRVAVEEGERRRPELELRLTEALRPHLRDDGVYLRNSAWIVVAKNPS